MSADEKTKVLVLAIAARTGTYMTGDIGDVLAAALEYAAEVLVEESLSQYGPRARYSEVEHGLYQAEEDIRILRNYAHRVRKIG